MDETYDVVVVGGGAAGLSGALALSRARRSVLVIDAGRAAQRAGRAGAQLPGPGGRRRRPSCSRSGGPRSPGTAGEFVAPDGCEAATRDDDGFRLTLDGGRSVRARRLLVTTGLTDELPDVPGLAERWGRDVLHCPYCHGWEVRDRRIGVLATGPLAVHQAELWRQWSPHVLLLAARRPGTGRGGRRAARRPRHRGGPGPVAELEVTDDALTGVRLADGRVVALDAVVVATRLTARAGVLEGLGLAPEEVTMGEHVIGARSRPTPPAPRPSRASGWRATWPTSAARSSRPPRPASTPAAAINADLIAEETRARWPRTGSVVAHDVRGTGVGGALPGPAAVWSGRPNPQLVAEVAGLAPGRALDVGSGEGADAVWLAERGWQVTAVDISTTALDRAAAHADDRRRAVPTGSSARHADLRDKPPAEGAYDLVSAQFMHLPPARPAGAVRPAGRRGGPGRHPADRRAPPVGPADLSAPDALPGHDVHRRGARRRPRPGGLGAAGRDPPPCRCGHEGEEVTHHDAVLVARRLVSPAGDNQSCPLSPVAVGWAAARRGRRRGLQHPLDLLAVGAVARLGVAERLGDLLGALLQLRELVGERLEVELHVRRRPVQRPPLQPGVLVRAEGRAVRTAWGLLLSPFIRSLMRSISC